MVLYRKYLAFSLGLMLTTGCASSLQQGAARQAQGDLDGALQLYQEAASQTPDDPAVQNNLAVLYLQRHAYRQAIAAYQRAVTLAPDNPIYRGNLERAFEKIAATSDDPALVAEVKTYLADTADTRQAALPAPASPGTPAAEPEQPASTSDTATETSVSEEPTEALAPNPTENSQALLAEMQKLREEVRELKQTNTSPDPNASETATFTDYSQLKERENIKWALVIGIGAYDKAKTSYDTLPSAAEDAKKVYNFLTTKGGFKPENVKRLIDKEATAENIREGLHQFLRLNATRPDDIVFIYYSGHGELYNHQDAYIVPYGAERSKIVGEGISLDEVNKGISYLGSKKVAMFIDSCHSGSIVQGVNSRGVLQDMAGIAGNFLSLASPGRLVMTSSTAAEESLETQDKGGLFTHYLLKGLNGEADSSHDGQVTVNELYDYIFRNVDRDALNLKNQHQSPQKNGDLNGVLFRVN